MIQAQKCVFDKNLYFVSGVIMRIFYMIKVIMYIMNIAIMKNLMSLGHSNMYLLLTTPNQQTEAANGRLDKFR